MLVKEKPQVAALVVADRLSVECMPECKGKANR